MYILKQVLKSRHVFHSTLLTLSFDRNMVGQHYALNTGVGSFLPFSSLFATLLKVCLVFLFTLLCFRTYSTDCTRWSGFLWRFPAFAWCTVWSWSLIVLSAPPYLRHAYCRARSGELDRSLWSSALSGSPPLHCCCCCLTQTLCCTATNLQKFQSSRSDPAASQLPTRPSKRDNMPKIVFSNTASKIITRI